MKINNKRIIRTSGVFSLLTMSIMNIYIATKHYHVSTIKLNSFYFHQSDSYDLSSPLTDRVKVSVAGGYEIDDSRNKGKRGVVYKRTKTIQYIDAK